MAKSYSIALKNKSLILAIATFVIVVSITATLRFSDLEIFEQPSPEGKIVSDHVHAWFKVFINQHQIDFFPETYPEFGNTNELIFLDSAQDGTVLHQFSDKATLDIFFKSMNMSFNSNCFVISDYLMNVQPRFKQKEYCNEDDKKMYFTVNGSPNDQWENYVFQEQDKIMIAYGNYTEQDIKRFEGSIGWSTSNLG